jgi:GWxTD domain-containing protein
MYPIFVVFFRVFAAFLIVASAALPAALASRHKEWLSGPTSYLITNSERSAFNQLTTDEERDKFVERFWEVRNPKPGTGENEFKEEFYRRLAFVNNFYGKDAGSDGWRTDRGKTYLLFGKPQSQSNFSGNSELVPAELWFYANPGARELPSFFYVLFFDRTGSGEYRFYHPYIHGPDKLVRSEPTKAQAYQYLRTINPELARASLSLVPGEPVDTETYAGSISSAQIMNGIQGYRELKSYESFIANRYTTLEQVQSRVEYNINRADLITLIGFESGEPWLHWHFELKDVQAPETGKMAYEVRAKLFSGETLIYERQDSPSLDRTPAMAKRAFAYQDRMPVVPGKYRLQVVAKDPSGKQFEASRDVEVAGLPDRPTLSQILVAGTHAQDPRHRPFGFGGFHFTPMAEPVALASRGVSLLYQIRLPQQAPGELEVEYLVADSRLKAKKTMTETVTATAANAHGVITTAKTLPIEEFGPGMYQLSVRIKDLKTGQISAQTARFTVATELDSPPVLVSPGNQDAPVRVAAGHYERALVWLAQGNPSQAIKSLEASYGISNNPAVLKLMLHLQKQINQADASSANAVVRKKEQK